MEDSKNVPVGKVLKVDGPYCAVRFPTSAQETCHAISILSVEGSVVCIYNVPTYIFYFLLKVMYRNID